MADLQKPAGLAAIPARLFQRPGNHDLLKVPARRLERIPHRKGSQFTAGRPGPETIGQVLRLQLGFLGQDHGALDDIFELPDVAGPGMPQQSGHGCG